MTRTTDTTRHVRGGCFVCHGTEAHWIGPHAHGIAARHHDKSGHATWCDVQLEVRYGLEAADPRQIDIEDSIAATEPGDRPVSIPRPNHDAPAVPAADVSARKGRSSRSALAAAKPEHVHV